MTGFHDICGLRAGRFIPRPSPLAARQPRRAAGTLGTFSARVPFSLRQICAIVYDNQAACPDVSDDADPRTAIDRASIDTYEAPQAECLPST